MLYIRVEKVSLMEGFYESLGNYIKDDVQNDWRQDRARKLAILAMTLHKFINVICDEVERAGYGTMEFSSNVELFLKSVTPDYPIQSFEATLEVLKSTDPNMKETSFFYGLNCLREMLSHDIGEARYNPLARFQMDQASIIFMVNLIDTISGDLYALRRMPDTRTQTISYVRQHIDARFDDLVLKVIKEVCELEQNIN